MEIAKGLKGQSAQTAERKDTAREMGSGSFLVYATPAMTALMENAACAAIEGCLPEGKSSVGIEMNLKHISATPVGMEVRAEAELTAVDGSILTSHVEAYDEAGKIGEAEHRRAVISTERFLEKAYAKL